jgi:prepilin-type N-terminal cleavage/methylation domain-containing protein
MNQKGFGLLEIILVVAVIGLLTYGGYSFWQKGAKVDINNTQQVENKINEIRQNPVELRDIKMKAQNDIEAINKRIASSTENY